VASHGYQGDHCGPEVLFPEVTPKPPPELGNIVPGVFTPVLAKHTKSFNLIDTLSVGVDRIQRNFEPLQRQVELSRKTQITNDTARLDLCTRRSSMAGWKRHEACFPRSTGCILSRSTRNSRDARCGVCPMHSPAPSRSWIRSRGSKPRPSWANFSVNCLRDPCDPVHGCDSANGNPGRAAAGCFSWRK